jgi:hypothetical protein
MAIRHRLRLPRLLVGLLVASAGAGCSGDRSPAAPSVGVGGSGGTGQTVTVLGVGDIGLCGSPGVEPTALLVDRTPGLLLLAGDIAYMHGAARDFQRCFDPFWGRFRDRWRAVPGNHEYETAGAGAFFDYFGDAAGPDRSGHYSLRLGDWLVLMLNSNVPAVRHSGQWEFVRRELESNRLPCVMAVWHHPLFSSGPNGPSPVMRDIWGLLDASGAELVVTGHEHLYERFAPQTMDGRTLPRGLRQFTAGTGGAELYRFVGRAPNSEVRITQFGIIRLTLQPAGYQWEFLTIDGSIPDSGTETCR